MRTVRDVMTVDPLHIGPQTTVQAAVLLLRTYSRLVLPVIEERQVVGIVDAVTLFMYQPDIAVADIMASPISVGADLPLSAAAGLMRAHCLTEMPVLDGEVLGVLKGSDLLTAWAMPVDPLTRLPWQDSFRLRSSMQLDAGNELTILFFDMDDFGALNKTFGHVVGDRALQTVANAIRDAMDPASDEACRFGGDEFVVSTTRTRSSAEEWATAVRETIARARVDGLESYLSVSVGVAGGLRQNERPGSHAPSTLDDLINRASQASTRAKTEPDHISSLDEVRLRPLTETFVPCAEFSARPARIRIQKVLTGVDGDRVHADVCLEFNGEVHIGTAEGPSAEEPSVVADAARQAIARFLPACYVVEAVHVREQALGPDERVMMAMVRFQSPHGWQNLVGVADVATNARRAVVKAILDALNRPLEALTQPAHLVVV